uniref:Uncharacterized protein n=1 Tax=Aegilops tauschii subsp. strangulata TaxID=200361 RepID=A0A453GCK4_AEGTS
MDSWEHKMPSWDLGTVVAPSGGGGGGGGGGGALDLKLGAPTSWRPVPAAAAAAAAVVSVQQQQRAADGAAVLRGGVHGRPVPVPRVPPPAQGLRGALQDARRRRRRPAAALLPAVQQVPFARGVRRGEEELQEAARRPQPAPPEAAAGSPQSCRLVR